MKCLTAIFSITLIVVSANLATSQQKPQTTFIIVHGAWGGSWAFKKVDSLMTAHGHLVYRPSLTGQGERVHLATSDVTLSTHIADVVNVILFEDLYDVVLVGHSYGGMVITGVADQLPDRIKKLIYLDAFFPNNGESVFTSNPGNREWIRPMEKNGMIVPSWVKADQPVPKDVPQSLKTFSEEIQLKNPEIKKTGVYILTVDKGRKAEDDTFYIFSERAKKRGWKYVEMAADHNPQWSNPTELARLLEENQ